MARDELIFERLKEGLVEGRISRREFVQHAAVLGLSTLAVQYLWNLGVVDPSSALAASSANPIKIGVNVELSHGWETYGGTFVNAVKLAAKEINDAGGLLGRPLSLIVEDNQVDPKVVVQKAQKLIFQDNVDVIVGPIASSSRDAMGPLVVQNKKIELYPIQYEGGVCSKYIFITGPVPNQQIFPTVPWLMEKFGKRWYLFGSDYVWPHKMNAIVRKRLIQLGGTVVGEEYAPIGTSEFSSTINKIQRSGATAVFMELTGADVIAFSKQFYGFGLSKKIQQISLAHDNNLNRAIGAQAAEGIISVNSYFPELDTPENRRFVSSFHKEFGENAVITYITEPVYNIVKLYGQAVKQAGSMDTEKVIDALEGQRFNAPSGPIRMRRRDHHTVLSMFIGQVDRSIRYRILNAWHNIEPDDQCGGKGPKPAGYP